MSGQNVNPSSFTRPPNFDINYDNNSSPFVKNHKVNAQLAPLSHIHNTSMAPPMSKEDLHNLEKIHRHNGAKIQSLLSTEGMKGKA